MPSTSGTSSSGSTKGDKLLAGRPEALDPCVLFGELKVRDDHVLITASPKREKYFKDLLADMRQRCDQIIHGKVGRHGNTGNDQERAAWAAIYLIDEHGLRRTYDTDGCVFREVAQLFFEAMTGENKDIYRACARVAQKHKAEIELGLVDPLWFSPHKQP